MSRDVVTPDPNCQSCPFCDSGAKPYRMGSWAVTCVNPSCMVSGPAGDTRAEAIERWNTRAKGGER